VSISGTIMTGECETRKGNGCLTLQSATDSSQFRQ
jgi:hypothetical protein